jgi:hypothetical protein
MGWGMSPVARARTGAVAVPLALLMLVGTAPADAMTAPPSDVPDHTASFNGVVRTVTYRGGVAYLGGDFTVATQGGVDYPRPHLAAVDATTGTLLPWRPRANGSVYSLRVGKTWTYVGGDFTRIQSRAHVGLARVATRGAGKVDQRFKARVPGEVRAIAMYHKRLYVGGTFVRANRHVRKHLAAFRPKNGSLVASWQPDTDGGVNVIKVAGHWLYIGGGFQHLNESTRGRNIAAVSPVSAKLRTGFRSSVRYAVNDIEVTSTRIYAAADGPGGHLRSLNLSGRAMWNLTLDGGTRAITLLDGTLYVGGHFDHACPKSHPGATGGCNQKVERHKFIAASARTGNLLPWAPDGNSALGTLALDSSTSPVRVGAGGTWTSLGATQQYAQAGFAQFR